MIQINDIRILVDRIVLEFNPDKIILFGSYSSGEPSPDSDVDLLVVMPHKGKNWRLAAEIRRRVRPEFPIDLLVRSPEEMQRRADDGDPFLSDIMNTGEVLYESHHA